MYRPVACRLPLELATPGSKKALSDEGVGDCCRRRPYNEAVDTAVAFSILSSIHERMSDGWVDDREGLCEQIRDLFKQALAASGVASSEVREDYCDQLDAYLTSKVLPAEP